MGSAKNKVVLFHEAGDASVLQIEELPLTEPGENEIRIKVKAIGLNRAEVMFRNAAYLEMPEYPSRLGYEAAGVIDAVGDSVSNFKIGDRVSTIPAFSMGKYGVYAEQAIVPVNAVEHCPENFTFQQSASIWMQYITAYGALIEIGQLQAGQQVLITAASSSVGVAAIQLAKSQGAIVIATTRGESKKRFLLEHGADYVVQTDNEDWPKDVENITKGQGVDLIFDPIGGPILAQLAEAAGLGARIIEYGALDSNPTPYPLFPALAKGLIIQGYTLFEITKNDEKLQRAKAYLLPLFNAQQLEPVIDSVFPFSEIQQAHEYMEANQQMGKIIVTV